MAWTVKLPSGRWQGLYRDPDGRRHTQTWPTKTAARQWAAAEELAARSRAPGLPDARTVADWWAIWRPAWQVEASTAAAAQIRWDKYLQPAFGDLQLARVSTFAVQQWASRQLIAGVGRDTVRACVGLLSTCLAGAVRAGMITANPCGGVRLPRSAKRPPRYLTRAQVDDIAEHLTGPAATMVIVAAYTGLRWGELAGLHAHRVDVDGRRLVVAETLEDVRGHLAIRPYPKSSTSARTVPLASRAAGELKVALEQHPVGLLFTDSRGHPLRREHMRRRTWQPAVQAAKVGEPAPRWHDLRHTCASWLVQAGVPILEVSRILGHSNVTTTQRYAHLAPDQYDRVLEALDG